MIKVYTYEKCGTCRKAKKWLKEHQLPFEDVAIRETPPTESEITRMLKHYGGNLRRLFNTSGQDYRQLGLKDRLPELTEREAIKLLTTNGNLVKRPFLLSDSGCLVGFDEEDWSEALLE